jgi:hypothetical protein
MLLKHFVDDNDQLSFYQTDAPERGVRRQTPRTLFLENHLYTFTDFDGCKDFSTEAFFSELESEADSIVCKIVENARNGKLSGLTLDERLVFDWFFVTLYRRLPDVFARLLPDFLDSKDFQRQYRDCEGIGEADPIKREAMEEFLWKEIWPRSLPIRDELMEHELLPTLSRMKLWVAVVPQGQAGLIVGSNPVITVAGHLCNPDSERIVALAHDVAVSYIHNHQEIPFELTDKDVRDFNRHIFGQSTMVAGRSREQIECLAAASNSKTQ